MFYGGPSDRYDVPTDPPDDPPSCGECRYCIDAGITGANGGICVHGHMMTDRYDDLKYVEWWEDPCEFYKEG